VKFFKFQLCVHVRGQCYACEFHSWFCEDSLKFRFLKKNLEKKIVLLFPLRFEIEADKVILAWSSIPFWSGDLKMWLETVFFTKKVWKKRENMFSTSF